MYSSCGSNAYGQPQPYTPQDLAARILAGGSQEGELTGYRGGGGGHGRGQVASAAPPSSHYSGQYGSVYGSGAQQMSPMGTKGSVTTLEGRSNYAPSMPGSPKFGANEYVPSSSRGYGQKVDQLYSDRISEYPSVDGRRYAERHSAYLGRDLPSETANRYVDSVAFGHEQQSKLYERLEQATLLRQEQALKVHALQSASVEGGARQADYLAARSGLLHPPAQDAVAYGGRIDPEARGLSMISGSSYGGQHATSILGAAPHRSIDDLIYAQTSSNPGYGVSLPPGRDYGVGKGLHGSKLESDYSSNLLGRGSHTRVDDRKDDRGTYGRDLERREKDRDYLRDREKSREREKEKDRLRERERERDREREKERNREREREHERERERERARERDRREDRDRESKRALELKRERTPPRVSRDRRGTSVAKDIKSLRRESPRREVSHRPHSPVKEKRREYSCKVFSFSFVEAERDYLSLDKRYPRLYISPECSKVVACWPKNNLKVPFYTPVSFEHDFVEEAAVEKKEMHSTQLTTNISKAYGGTTIWNAKIILMSGLSQNAQAELSSDRTYDDRIPHFCNMLRFAVLKKNSSLMAIGGAWDSVDGVDPSVDDSSLIRTAMRYAKDVTGLDLKNCQRWNRFLEIHYQRVGKDGLFSHNEVTVLYVPDLSECLPSLDSWRDQWLMHKKTVSERERLHALKKEIPGDKEETPKDKKKLENVKGSKAKVEMQKKKEPSSDIIGDDSIKKKDAQKLENKGPLISEGGKGKEKAVEDKEVVGTAEDEKIVVKTAEEGNSNSQTAVGVKTGKKKIVKRIIKKLVPKKRDGAEIAKKQNSTEIVMEQNSTEIATKQNDEVAKDSVGGRDITSEVDGKQDDLSSNPPSVRKKIVKKTVNSALEKNESSPPEVKTAKESGSSEDKAKIKSEDSDAVVEGSSSKTTVKKKVVRKVPKKKAAVSVNNNKVAEDDLKAAEKIVHSEQVKEEQNEETVENQVKKVTSQDKNSPKVNPEKKADKKNSSGSVMEIDTVKQKVSQNDNSKKSKKEEVKDDKETKDVEKNEFKKSNKTTKEKNRDEPPRHPGFLLQTKGNKDSKVQTLSLSLDSLLEYNDKDIEDSSFELSLFAESLYEMLQYEMGSRLLDFLQKLRIKFVLKRNQGKRQRKEKENEDSSSRKRVKKEETVEDAKSTKTENKTDKNVVDNKSTKTENKTDKNMVDKKSTDSEVADEAHEDGSKIVKEETDATEKIDEIQIEDDMEEEDPEEDPEEDEEMPEANADQSPTEEETPNAKKTSSDAIGEDNAEHEQKKQQGSVKQTSESIINLDPSSKDLPKVEAKTKEIVINTELLQAFRFFDRNRVGYIRVEDLRLVLHNLGKCLPHRDVKELVQSALLESNTGRDDRILYDKLLKMSDI